MNIGTQAIREFREVYLVSNTPLYLFKRLRRLPAVHQLAHAADTKELLSEYLRRAKAEKRTLDDVATAYACLMAMTHKDPREIVSLLRSLDPTDLNWVSTIRDLYFVKVPAGSIHYITMTNPPVLAACHGNDATASFAYTDAPKPTIERKANL